MNQEMNHEMNQSWITIINENQIYLISMSICTHDNLQNMEWNQGSVRRPVIRNPWILIVKFDLIGLIKINFCIQGWGFDLLTFLSIFTKPKQWLILMLFLMNFFKYNLSQTITVESDEKAIWQGDPFSCQKNLCQSWIDKFRKKTTNSNIFSSQLKPWFLPQRIKKNSWISFLANWKNFACHWYRCQCCESSIRCMLSALLCIIVHFTFKMTFTLFSSKGNK